MQILLDSDVLKIKKFINNKTNICLQFPDHLLKKAPKIAHFVQSLTAEPVFILADTTMGSCCIDKVAGEHGNAGGIIHFGPACLSIPSKDCPPVLWLFEHIACNILKLVEYLKDVERPTLILTETGTFHILEQLEQALDNDNLIFSTIMQESNPGEGFPVTKDEYLIQGRKFTLPPSISLSDISLFYIGKESLTLNNIIMNMPFKYVSVYDVETEEISGQPVQAISCIRKRFVMVQKAKDANVIGIVVGTLGIGKEHCYVIFGR
jgi:diphthamide biosynthesis protein 2